ncbi:unknown [Clostridium sp. CAG:448]|nr:unknown [Clostridium sp. CAG:448]
MHAGINDIAADCTVCNPWGREAFRGDPGVSFLAVHAAIAVGAEIENKGGWLGCFGALNRDFRNRTFPEEVSGLYVKGFISEQGFVADTACDM